MPDITLIAICVGYALYNAIRKTLPIALPLLMHDLGLSKSEVGQIASSFAVAYGCSKFGSSVISDYINCKKLFTLGLLCTSLTSLLFPFVGSSVVVLSVVWCVNGLVQGVGWPSVSKIIYLSYVAERRGTAWSAASTAGNVGLILGSMIFPVLLRWGWKVPFVVCGGLGVAVAVVCYLSIPSDIDMDHKTAEENSTSPVKKSTSSNQAEKKDPASSWQWLVSVPLWCLFMGSMCAFFLQRGLADWAGLFFFEKYGWDTSAANSLVFANEVGGVIGSLAAGVISDLRLVDYRKDVTCLLFAALLLPSYGFLSSLSALDFAAGDGAQSASFSPTPPCKAVLAVCLLVVGVGASGPKTLLGLMVRNAVPVSNMGLAGGVLGFVGQIGGAMAGGGLGTLIELQGWGAFFPALLGVSILCVWVIVVYMWSEKEKKRIVHVSPEVTNHKKTS